MASHPRSVLGTDRLIKRLQNGGQSPMQQLRKATLLDQLYRRGTISMRIVHTYPGERQGDVSPSALLVAEGLAEVFRIPGGPGLRYYLRITDHGYAICSEAADAVGPLLGLVGDDTSADRVQAGLPGQDAGDGGVDLPR